MLGRRFPDARALPPAAVRTRGRSPPKARAGDTRSGFRGARREIHSWYLRLWPWEGNDLLYGLLRVEARAHPETVARASEIGRASCRERVSVWAVGESGD